MHVQSGYTNLQRIHLQLGHAMSLLAVSFGGDHTIWK
jgi:hypothetical protein